MEITDEKTYQLSDFLELFVDIKNQLRLVLWKEKQKSYWSVDGRAENMTRAPIRRRQEETRLHLKIYLRVRVGERSILDVSSFSV